MKVLQVNCVYNKGSTGKITADLHHGMIEKGIDSVVCYGRAKKSEEKDVYKTCPEWYSKLNNLFSRFSGIMYGGCFFSTGNLISVIKKKKPDIVHLQCINGYFVNIYRLVSWLKKHNIPTVLTLHAEFMYTGGCAYSVDCENWTTPSGCTSVTCPRWRQETLSWFFDRTGAMWKKMKKAFDGFDQLRVIAVSKWIGDRAKVSPIFADKNVSVIYNGIRTECFDYQVSEFDNEVMKKYGVPLDKKLILHVTPSFDNPIKGGHFFEEISHKLDDSYCCVVVGAKRGVSDKIISIPFTNNQLELAALYKKASVFVITSVSDNYPTVCLEANCCGTPVVGFDVGGVKETIYPGMGEVVDFGNIDRLQEAVCKWAETAICVETVESCIQKNDRNRMTEDYMRLYRSVVSEKNDSCIG